MFLTVLNSRTATPSVTLNLWRQHEAAKAEQKAQHINVETDPYQARLRIQAAYRAEVTPPTDAVNLTDHRAVFLSSVLAAIEAHQYDAAQGNGEATAHADCIAAWKLVGKAAQVGLSFDDLGRFVEIAERRSANLIEKVRRARKAQRRAAQ
jgi:hypothetical protein